MIISFPAEKAIGKKYLTLNLGKSLGGIRNTWDTAKHNKKKYRASK